MFSEKWDMGACSTGHFATEKSIITFSKRCDCTPMIAFVQIWKPSLWVGCAEIQFTYVHLILVGTSLVLSLKSKGQLGFWSARKKPNKGNQNQRKDKQITTKKNPSRYPKHPQVCAEERKEDSDSSTCIEVISGNAFWLSRWRRPEVDGRWGKSGESGTQWALSHPSRASVWLTKRQ